MVLAYCFLFESFPAPSLFSDMELELSLGDSPAPLKANILPAAPALTLTCEGEDDDLMLGLGVTATETADQGSQRTSTERGEETVEGEGKEACPEPPVGCPIRQASAQSGKLKRILKTQAI